LTEFDIIIQAGQSNAEGVGTGETENEYLPNDNVYYLNAEKTAEIIDDNLIVTYADKPFLIEVAAERQVEDRIISDFSLFFARKYVENGLLKDGRKLLIIRAGVGGTGFKKGFWGVNDALYKKMIEMVDYALSLNKNNRIVGLLWHQGEHDAFEKNDPNVFEGQLLTMLTSVRARYGEMPVIAGDFVREWKQKNIELCEPIIEKIKKVLKEIGVSAFVETGDLPSNNEKTGNGDDIHFCRDSLRILGERYFEKFKTI
jgi:hypothetical protein